MTEITNKLRPFSSGDWSGLSGANKIQKREEIDPLIWHGNDCTVVVDGDENTVGLVNVTIHLHTEELSTHGIEFRHGPVRIHHGFEVAEEVIKVLERVK